jgi:fucose permease
MNEKKSSVVLALVPVMLCFFAMGFVDLVGTATNFVKSDFQLSDSIANLLPSMVFVMFLLFSVPSGLLMNKIGRKQTVLISLVITLVALLIPCFIYSYWTMLASFILLGIGNAVLQTSLNPLVSNVIRSDKLASSMTFGQFVKAIASFLAPVIAAWGVSHPVFGLSWRILFPIYTIVGVIATLWLFATPIEEENVEGHVSSFKECFSLLGNRLFCCASSASFAMLVLMSASMSLLLR